MRVFTLTQMLAAGLLLHACARGATHFGDISVAVESPQLPHLFHGYAEHRIRVTNRSASQAHVVQVIAPARAFGSRGDHLRRLARTVRVGPSSTVFLSLMQPALPRMGDNSLAVVIDGERQDAVLGLVTAAGSASYTDGHPLVLVSASVPENRFQKLVPKPRKGKKSIDRWPPIIWRSSREVAFWSPDWLAYSRYDGVVITAREMNEMPAPVRSALLRYTEAGGGLLVLGEWAMPQSWQAKTTDWGTRAYPGFGECWVVREDAIEFILAGEGRRMKSMWQNSHKPWRHTRDVAGANRSFPVVDSIQIPVRPLFGLMLLFVILIGPVNLIVLHRKKKRIWMLWTVPAISALTCLAVTIFAFLGEGFSGHARTRTLTVLDETTHRATTIGITAFYSPLTPGDGLHFSYETELTPQLSNFTV